MQETDPCDSVDRLVYGEKGENQNEVVALVNCFDYEIKAVQ